MTRPRKPAPAAPSRVAAIAIMATFWANPASRSASQPRAQARHLAEAQQHDVPGPGADQRRARRVTRPARQDGRDRGREAAEREAGDQPAEARRVDAVDPLGDIGQEPVRGRVGGQVDQERQQHHGEQLRRPQDVDQAFHEVAPAGWARREGRAAPRPPDRHRRPARHAEGQREARQVEARDDEVGIADPERRGQPRAGERAGDAGRVHGGARQAEGAHQVLRRDRLADERVPHHEVVGAHDAGEGRDDEHPRRGQHPARARHHQQRSQRRVDRAHRAQHRPAPQAVAQHPEHRRGQRAEYCSEANAVSSSTEPVWTMTYQPRTSVSISNAHEVRRSADHWKRKLRTRNAARITVGSSGSARGVARHHPSSARRTVGGGGRGRPLRLRGRDGGVDGT